MTRLSVGVVGAGFISDEYLTNLTAFADVEVTWVADADRSRARTQADRFHVPNAGSIEDVLADPDVDLVLDLTTPDSHEAINRAALEAGKHVWSEKPLSQRLRGGEELALLAERKGLRLGAAPDTVLSAGFQETRRRIRSGEIGEQVHALALMQTGGLEAWHPNPEFAYAAGSGPLFELGPYFITGLVHLLGSVRAVEARAQAARSQRSVVVGPRAGTRFEVLAPTDYTALLEFDCGAQATLILSFDSPIDRLLFEVTGTDGTIAVPAPTGFDGMPTLYDSSGTITVEGSDGARSPFGRGAGVLELARAIDLGTPSRTDAAVALHVLETITEIERAAAERSRRALHSRAPDVECLPPGWDPIRATETGSIDLAGG